jgi:hypothetical protein
MGINVLIWPMESVNDRKRLTELVVLIESLLLSDLEPLGAGGGEIVFVVGHCLQI